MTQQIYHSHFNSRPHEEVDITAGVNLIFQLAFQLTTSRRGRRNRNHCDHDQGNFNSRPHEEVDTVSIGLVAVLLIFQLTTSRRGRQLLQIEQTVFMAFQLTTSRRGRLVLPLDNRSTHQYFNSRPHEEVDCQSG